MAKKAKKSIKKIVKKAKKDVKKAVKKADTIVKKAKLYTEAEVQVKLEELARKADNEFAEMRKNSDNEVSRIKKDLDEALVKLKEEKEKNAQIIAERQGKANDAFETYKDFLRKISNCKKTAKAELEGLKTRVQKKAAKFISAVTEECQTYKEIISWLKNNWNEEMMKLEQELVEQLRAQKEVVDQAIEQEPQEEATAAVGPVSETEVDEIQRTEEEASGVELDNEQNIDEENFEQNSLEEQAEEN